ncbi:TPA: hypothetical protein ACWX2Y_004788, partial [Escherichia coli]
MDTPLCNKDFELFSRYINIPLLDDGILSKPVNLSHHPAYRYTSRYVFNLGAFPGFAGEPAVVLRIEPLRVSPLPGVHPRP